MLSYFFFLLISIVNSGKILNISVRFVIKSQLFLLLNKKGKYQIIVNNIVITLHDHHFYFEWRRVTIESLSYIRRYVYDRKLYCALFLGSHDSVTSTLMFDSNICGWVRSCLSCTLL